MTGSSWSCSRKASSSSIRPSRHLQVGHDHVGRELGRHAERDAPSSAVFTDEALLLQQPLEAGPGARFIIDDEECRPLLFCSAIALMSHLQVPGIVRPAGPPHGQSDAKDCTAGTAIHVNRAAVIVTIRCAMANPSPVPDSFVEKKASKMGESGRTRPGPSSSTSRTMCRG